MMQRYFVNTFYLVAISNPRDQGYRRAMAFSQSLEDYHLYTVDEVLAEYLTFFSTARPHVREQAAVTAQDLLNDPTITVILQSRTSFETALAFYASRLDKHYSHTDCVSMLAMRRVGPCRGEPFQDGRRDQLLDLLTCYKLPEIEPRCSADQHNTNVIRVTSIQAYLITFKVPGCGVQ